MVKSCVNLIFTWLTGERVNIIIRSLFRTSFALDPNKEGSFYWADMVAFRQIFIIFLTGFKRIFCCPILSHEVNCPCKVSNTSMLFGIYSGVHWAIYTCLLFIIKVGSSLLRTVHAIKAIKKWSIFWAVEWLCDGDWLVEVEDPIRT